MSFATTRLKSHGTLRRPRSWSRLVAGSLVIIASLFTSASAATAHSSVTSTFPSDGEQVAVAPQRIELVLNESVTLGTSAVRVVNSKSENLPLTTELSVVGTSSTITSTPTSNLADGWYAVAWEVVSADGHPKSGTFTFLVGKDRSVATASIDDPTALYRKLSDPLRFLGYLTTLLAIGFLVAMWPLARIPSAVSFMQRAASWTAGLGLVVAPLTIANFTILLNGGSFDEIGSVFVIALQSSAGTALLVRTSALFALCTAVLLASERSFRYVALVAGALGTIGLAASFAFSGHTTVVPRSAFAGPLLVVHLAAGAVWLGGLPAMAWAFSKRRELNNQDLAFTISRFSALATVSVFVVGLAGTALSVMMFNKPGEVLSKYGYSLMGKIAAVAIFAGIGAYNHFVLVPNFKKANSAAALTDESGETVSGAQDGTSGPQIADEVRASKLRSGLRRSLLVESFGVVILALLTTYLTTSAAPAAGGSHGLGESHGHSESSSVNFGDVPLVIQGTLGQGGVELTITPPTAGTENTISVNITDVVGKTIKAEAVEIELTQTDLNIGPILRKLEAQSNGKFSLTSRDLGIPGNWTATITVKTGTLSSEKAELKFVLQSPDAAPMLQNGFVPNPAYVEQTTEEGDAGASSTSTSDTTTGTTSGAKG